MRISRVIFICCFLLPFLASCTRDEIEANSYPLSEYDGTGVLFRLKAEAFDDTTEYPLSKYFPGVILVLAINVIAVLFSFFKVTKYDQV